MFKKKFGRNLSNRKRSASQKKHSPLLELAIAAVFIVVVVFAASFAIRVTHGVSKTVDTPQYTVRLQILNGCGTKGVAGRIAKTLPSLVKLPVEINIVDIDDFNAYHVTESFLISRDQDTNPTRILSQQLNLAGDVVYEPMENNYRSIMATLVVGDDYDKLLGNPNK